MVEGILMNTDYQGLALFLLRVVLGITFLAHGIPKITNLAGARNMFSHWAVPIPALTSFYSALAESLGGLLILLGFYSGWASLALIVDMLGAMIFVTWKRPFKGGWELNLLLLTIAITILLAGPGDYTLATYIELYE